MNKTKKYQSFEEFYPFYLSQHVNKINKTLHIIGTTLVFFLFIYALLVFNFKLFVYIPIVGYGFAWIGHFFFEKNRPATFQYPIYSLFGDFKMWFGFVKGL